MAKHGFKTPPHESDKEMAHLPGNQELEGHGSQDGMAEHEGTGMSGGRRSSYGKNHSMASNLPGNTILEGLRDVSGADKGGKKKNTKQTKGADTSGESHPGKVHAYHAERQARADAGVHQGGY